ncbi:MAG: TraB family protein [Candidatus Alkanophagales archaeon]|nr:MAG: TraB family protein [Candidatus Alkanophagales archaeon]
MVKIILVGTGHVLEKSVKEVKEKIEEAAPDVVAVELCRGRYKTLTGEYEFSVKDALKGGKPYVLMVQWLLAYLQKRLGADLGVEPGAEMLAAIEKAKELQCRVALIDRDISVTMQRFWREMRFFEKLKMVFTLISSLARGVGLEKLEEEGIKLEEITSGDVVTRLVEELRRFSPNAAKVLIDERDAYMAKRLLEVSNMLSKEKPDGKIVAVVGAGHVEGIKKYLESPESIPQDEELCRLPKRRFSLAKILGIIILVFVAFFLLAFSNIPSGVLLTALFYWFIINGVLSAAGVVAARGHPLSALTAFAVAWLTSLNPLMAAGWFAGLVELYMRKPDASDIKNMLNVGTFKELLQNRLFKVIFVAALANLGSMLGTFLGAYVVLKITGTHITVSLNTISEAFRTLLQR